MTEGQKVPHTVAIDFDGTLCEDNWPEIGEPIVVMIDAAKKMRENGSKLILWTCREGKFLDDALEWCKGYGLEFDAVNANIAERIEAYGNDSRKVGADEYWDDRSYNPSGMYSPFMQNCWKNYMKVLEAVLRGDIYADLCEYCKNYKPCPEDPKTCSDYIEGDECEFKGKQIKFHWSCQDLDFGDCNRLCETPCFGCIKNEWSSFELDYEKVEKKYGEKK